MHFILKIAPLSALLASVSFGQSDHTVETVFAKANSVKHFSPGEIVASKFFPVWQHQSFAGYPKQIPRRSAQQPKPRPRMEGSATGYIDNAIVGSQIRLRFDAGFNIQAPDRAEFFYAKCGCYRNPKADSNYDPQAPGPDPGIAKDLNFQELHLNVEYAPTQRLSFFADVPERSIEYTPFVNTGSLNNASGLGDFKAGIKFALVALPERYITFQMGAFMPTGHPSLGLGTNHFSVEPMLLYNQRLSDRVTIAGQFGDWHPIDGSAGVPTATAPHGFAGDVLTYGLGASYDFLSGSENHITPVLEFVGWSVLGGFATAAPGSTPPASGTNIVNGKLGVRFSFHTHNSIYAGFGQAITGARWYKEILRLEYRYAF